MFLRHQAILRLFENEGGSTSRLQLVNLAFLVRLEAGAPRTGVYEFLPYRSGPFSFRLYHDLRRLIADGWRKDVERLGDEQAAIAS